MTREEMLFEVLKNTDLFVKDVASIGNAILTEITKLATELFPPNMTMEDLQQVYQKPLDIIILEIEEEKGHAFVGGEFNIDYIDELTYTCSYVLYFQDANKHWIKSESKSKPMDQKLLARSAWEDIKKSGTIKFEVERPSSEMRAWFKANRR